MRYILVLLSCAVCGQAQSSSPVEWGSPIDGFWEDPTAWLQGRVPNQVNDDPVLGLMGSYEVTSQNDATYRSLSIENPVATLKLSSANHTLLSDLRNEGRVVVGSHQIGTNSSIIFGGFNSINGSGAVELISNTDTDLSQLDARFSVFTQEPGHSILGSGELLVTIMTNMGTIEAQGMTGLRLMGEFAQSSTGRIGADFANLLLKDGTVIRGGELYTSNSGEVFLEGALAELVDLSINAKLSLLEGAQQLRLGGDVLNNGQLIVDGRVNKEYKELYIQGNAHITGNGSIQLFSGIDPSVSVLNLQPNSTVTVENDIQTSGLIVGTPESLMQLNGQISSIPNLPQPTIQCPIAGPAEIVANQSDITLRTPTALTDFTLRSIDGGEFVLGIGTVTLLDCENNSTIRFDKSNARLEIRNELVNNGLIKIDATNLSSEAQVNSVGAATLSGSGSVELISGEDSDAVLSGGSNVLTFGPDQLVHGSGTVRSNSLGGNVINQGTIRTTEPGKRIYLRGNHQGDGGAYIADKASIELVSPVYVQSADFYANGDSEIRINRSTLESCTLHTGVLRVQRQSSPATIEGDMVNHGFILLERDTELVLAGNSTLSGSGEIHLEADAELKLGTFSDLEPPVIYEGHAITGAGTIRGTATLHSSSIISNDPDRTMYVTGLLTFENSQLISENGYLSILNRSVLTGAQLLGENIYAGSDVSLEECDIRTQLTVTGGINLLNGTVNNGTILLSSGIGNPSVKYLLLNPSGAAFEGTGIIELDAQSDSILSSVRILSTVNQTGRIGPDQKVIGAGQIIGRVAIQGELAPSGPRAEIQVTDLILEPGSKFIANLKHSNSTETSSQISVLPGGKLEVDGELCIDFADGFLPKIGFSHRVVRSITPKVPAVIEGEFDSIILPESPPGVRYMIQQYPDEILFLATCTPDFNGDSELDFLDIAQFIEGLQMRDPISDMNKDGLFDFFDISVFIQEFAQGCQE